MIGRKGVQAVTRVFIVMMFVFTLIFGILPFVFQQLSGQVPVFEDANSWLTALTGVKTIKWPDIFFYFIMPYIATTFIIFGLMEEIGIFRHIREDTRAIFYAIIAIGWAASLIPTGFLGSIAVVLYQVGAIFAIIIFFIAFLGGGLLWAVAFGKAAKGALGEIDQLRSEKNTILQQLQTLDEQVATGAINRDNYTKRVTALNVRARQIDTTIDLLAHYGTTPEKKVKP